MQISQAGLYYFTKKYLFMQRLSILAIEGKFSKTTPVASFKKELQKQEGNAKRLGVLLMRILGLDVGSKRIGIALSDEMGWTAQGKGALIRKGMSKDIEEISQLVAQYGVEEIVVGLPLNMNGSLGVGAREVLSFIEKIKGPIGLPIKTWDERLSTVAVERTLLEGDVSRKKRKNVIDKLAAVFILQGYLDSEKKGKLLK